MQPLFLARLITLSLILLQYVVAVPFRNKIFYDCTPEQENMLNIGLEDAYAMMLNAQMRAERTIQNVFFPTTYHQEAADRTTMRILEVMFGRVFFGLDDDQRNAKGLGTVRKHIERRIYLLLQAFQGDGSLELWCGDDWLLTHHPDPSQELPEDSMWDDRPEDRGGQVLMDTLDGCRADDVEAWQTDREDTPLRGNLLIIAFCKKIFDAVLGGRWRGQPVSLPPGLPDRTFYLETNCDTSIGSTIIHELSHSRTFLGEDATDDVGAPDAYSWEACVNLATFDPEMAAKNANNFMFFILAIWFDAYDWSDGFNRPALTGRLPMFLPLPEFHPYRYSKGQSGPEQNIVLRVDLKSNPEKPKKWYYGKFSDEYP
ncbi:hypothetical protein FQN57_004794 [Myotisia sp. PD_48]|nr:hypothetical protein FQN57_004794 [Myotisia sp. PD_48]